MATFYPDVRGGIAMDDADLSKQSKRTCNGSREPMPHTPHHPGPDRLHQRHGGGSRVKYRQAVG